MPKNLTVFKDRHFVTKTFILKFTTLEVLTIFIDFQIFSFSTKKANLVYLEIKSLQFSCTALIPVRT